MARSRTRRRRPARKSKPRARPTRALEPAPLTCEGLAFAIVDQGQSTRDGLLEAKRALRETFGPRRAWRVTPLGATVKEYIASPPRVPHELPLAEAWEQARQLA